MYNCSLSSLPMPTAVAGYGFYPCLSVCLSVFSHDISTSASAAADRPARRRGSTHAKYSVSHMVIKPFLLLGLAAECRSRRWVWSVWSTVVRRPSEVYDTHRRTKLTATETISRSRDVDNRRLNIPHLYLAPPLGTTPLEFRLDFWHQKTRVPGLSYGVVCVILGLAVLVEHRPVTDGGKDTRWRHVGYHASTASRG